jgi:hypothetical protein
MARATILVPDHECARGEPIFKEARGYSEYIGPDGAPFGSYDRKGAIIVPPGLWAVHRVHVSCVQCGDAWWKIEASDGTAQFEDAPNISIPAPKEEPKSKGFWAHLFGN